MKIRNIVKRASFGVVASGFLWSNLAVAQASPITPKRPVDRASASMPVRTSVHLSGSCSNCDLSRRIMPGMSLQGAKFSGSDFSHSNLSGANFNQANLNNASFYKAYLLRVEGGQVNLNKAVLRGTTLINAQLVSSQFVYADLQKADMTSGNFSQSDFTRAKMRNVDAIGTTFVLANFTRAKLDHADFTDANFTGANFLNAEFGDAVLEGADFTKADLSGAVMVEVVGLTQKQLDSACGSKTTQLPYGYSMRVCALKDNGLSVMNSSAHTPKPPVLNTLSRNADVRNADEHSASSQSTDAQSASAAKLSAIDLQTIEKSLIEPPMVFEMMTEAQTEVFERTVRLRYFPKTENVKQNRERMVSVRSSELDDIMRGIDAAIKDLPMSSPTRMKLEASKRKLEAVQAIVE